MTWTLDELIADATSRIHRYTPAEAHDADVQLADIRSQDAREPDAEGPPPNAGLRASSSGNARLSVRNCNPTLLAAHSA